MKFEYGKHLSSRYLCALTLAFGERIIRLFSYYLHMRQTIHVTNFDLFLFLFLRSNYIFSHKIFWFEFKSYFLMAQLPLYLDFVYIDVNKQMGIGFRRARECAATFQVLMIALTSRAQCTTRFSSGRTQNIWMRGRIPIEKTIRPMRTNESSKEP